MNDMNTINKKRIENINKFLNWLESKFPGSKLRILEKAGIRYNNLGNIGDSDSSLFDYSFFNTSPTAPVYDYPVDPAQGAYNPGSGATSSVDNSGWFTDTIKSIASAAETIIPAYANYEMQKDAYKIQMERAKQGREPIDMSRYAPVMRVQVRPDLRDMAVPEMDKQTKDSLMIAAGLIGGFFLLPKLLK